MLRRVAFKEAGLSIILAIQVAIMFVVEPLGATRTVSPLANELARLILAGVGLTLVVRNRAVAGVIAVSVAISLGLSLAFQSGDVDTVVRVVRLGVTTAFDLALAAAVIKLAFGPGRVTVHRIMGALILYLEIALIFANAFRACDLFLAHAFNGLTEARGVPGQMLYFSLSTLTTTGYGDIAPVHPFVRSLANLEAVMGQIFPATLLARLVTLHASSPNDDN